MPEAKVLLIFICTLLCFCNAQLHAQTETLSVQKQRADFEIFKGGLEEGHSGLYYFIEKKSFAQKCDSVAATFKEAATTESFYLKLRYLITLLNHGHTRIELPGDDKVNFKMAVLKADKKYLPLQLTILQNKLYVLTDCSDEQTIAKGAEIKSINGIAVKTLMQKMIHYIPADGINQSFKYYNLYNYYYFHFLYNLFYPSVATFDVELPNAKKIYRIKAKTPAAMESMYKKLNGKSSSYFDDPLSYTPIIAGSTAYIKVGSFYKGFIENFQHKFFPFIDSAFSDMANKQTKNLIVDLRDNEGGGDGYNDYLFAHLAKTEATDVGAIRVPGRTFSYTNYTVNLSDDVKGFMADPKEFLRDDTSLLLKDKYVELMTDKTPSVARQFNGNIYVLINGGTFSASTGFINRLYNYRQHSKAPIEFIGEENGGDIYSNVECAGQGYTIKLPNSFIVVDMPFLCFGDLKKVYPAKRLPDYKVSAAIKDLIAGRDTVLEFVLRKIKK